MEHEAQFVVRQSNEIDRMTEGLAGRYPHVESETVETLIRDEFTRRSEAPIQDFVPVFVERALRSKLGARQ